MQVDLQAGFELPFVLGKPINAKGEEVAIDGELQKLSSEESIFTVERDELSDNPDDPYVGKLVWRGEGEATFQVSGDADLGDGVDTIKLDIDVHALAEGAVGFAPISFGTARKHVEESPQAGE